jgi:polyphosphate kinase 2 (PPK2 family)
MTVFDRSWYGRVLVERVEGFATEEQWRRGYEEIDAFEKMLVDDRTILVKLWLHVSAEEQRRRFEARAKDPFKRFKLTDADWRNLALRPRYEQAVEDMLARTDTTWAPWTLVEAEAKRWARVKALEATIAAVEAGLRRWGLAPGPLPGDG